jgi:3-hydroxybutyryl-CoA dehydratase
MSKLDLSNAITRDPAINGFRYDELKVGDKAYYSKTVSESDIYTFAGITGDFNPAHTNEASPHPLFGTRICHGAFSAGLVSAALGMKMPGQGCLYLSQSSKFIKPVKFGDTITVKLEITKMDDEKKRVYISTECYNQLDELVLVGEAVILPKK